jgi:hypothetical protein
MRRICTIGILAAALALAALRTPGYARIASSARNFQQRFQELKAAGNSMGPVERFVFSLILAAPDRGWANGAGRFLPPARMQAGR